MVFARTKQKRIGIFGGTFDPPHFGHIAICNWLLEHQKVDAIWIIPCFEHPLGKEMSPYKDRKVMCHFAFDPLGKPVLIKDVEKKLGGISHTVRTIEYLKKHFPEHAFSLIVGEDIQNESHEWFQFGKIKQIIPLITIPRGKDSSIPDISSSTVREQFVKGESVVESVPTAVAVYMVTHGLYGGRKVNQKMSSS